MDFHKIIEEEIASRHSQDPVFWTQEFGDEYGLVEPERKEWKTLKEYEDFKNE